MSKDKLLKEKLISVITVFVTNCKTAIKAYFISFLQRKRSSVTMVFEQLLLEITR